MNIPFIQLTGDPVFFIAVNAIAGFGTAPDKAGVWINVVGGGDEGENLYQSEETVEKFIGRLTRVAGVSIIRAVPKKSSGKD